MTASPTAAPPTPARPPRGRAGRAFEIGLSLYGIAIFTVLWVGFAIGLATGGDLLVDAWAWLTGLEPIATVIAWILFLPIAVGLWAWNAVGSTLVIGAVAAGLVAWTLVIARAQCGRSAGGEAAPSLPALRVSALRYRSARRGDGHQAEDRDRAATCRPRVPIAAGIPPGARADVAVARRAVRSPCRANVAAPHRTNEPRP